MDKIRRDAPPLFRLGIERTDALLPCVLEYAIFHADHRHVVVVRIDIQLNPPALEADALHDCAVDAVQIEQIPSLGGHQRGALLAAQQQMVAVKDQRTA